MLVDVRIAVEQVRVDVTLPRDVRVAAGRDRGVGALVLVVRLLGPHLHRAEAAAPELLRGGRHVPAGDVDLALAAVVAADEEARERHGQRARRPVPRQEVLVEEGDVRRRVGAAREERTHIARRADDDGLAHRHAARRGREHLDRDGQLRRLAVGTCLERGQEQRPHDEVRATVDRDHRRVARPLLVGIRVPETDEVGERAPAVGGVAHAGDRRLQPVALLEREPGRVVPRGHDPPRPGGGDRRLALAAEQILVHVRRIDVRADGDRRARDARLARCRTRRVQPRIRAL